jgi:pSer/pThr/pTyr-binding forkhead associated (FHA) protein
MWKLTIEDDEGKRTPLPLARDEYAVGRGEDNTVRLTERNISRKHAAMRRMASGWLFVDLSSYNGSYVNGTRIAGEHIVSHGDVVQVGDYRLEFVDEEIAAKMADAANASTIPGGGTAAVKPDRLVVVVGVEPGAEFLIQSATLTIGRTPEADVYLAHSSVSRLHAEIHALGGGRYEIIDKASANGVRVNGSLLKRGLLEAGDFIDLGEIKLKFVGAGQNYRPGPEAVRLLPEKDDAAGASAARSPVALASAHSIERFVGGVGGRSKFLKSLIVGAAVGLIGVVAVVVWNNSQKSAWEAALASAALADPARAALDDASKLAASGDLDRAHARLAEIPPSSPVRDSREFQDLETRWADAVLGRAEHEGDTTTRRALLSSIAQCTTVDPGRRRVAAEKLKDSDLLGTDVRRLPAASKGNAADAAAGRANHPVISAEPSAPTSTGSGR